MSVITGWNFSLSVLKALGKDSQSEGLNLGSGLLIGLALSQNRWELDDLGVPAVVDLPLNLDYESMPTSLCGRFVAYDTKRLNGTAGPDLQLGDPS